MSSTRLKGEHVSLSGDLPENGTKLSLKELVRADLSSFIGRFSRKEKNS